MDFSIITSLYRSDRYLPEFEKHLRNFAIELESAGVSFELIAVANEATEAEKKFAENFSKEKWFKFVNIGREPLYATWNRGVGLSQSQIMGFWNVDDVRYANAVVKAKKLFKQGAELVHFPFLIKRYFKLGSWYLPLPRQKIDKQIPEYSENTRQQFLQGMVCGPFFMFTKQLYSRVGPFDEQFKIAGDFDWCVRAAKKTDKIVKAKTFGGMFRVDGGGLSAGGSKRQIVENNVIFRRNSLLKKIMVEDVILASQYRSNDILIAGEYRKL